MIFAGKAHPKDGLGKKLIREILKSISEYGLEENIVFLENYNINTARFMVRGVDVWLNNPRRPLEASGTSGMKAAMNGGLNVSILDGWWCEGYETDNGWAIGQGDDYEDGNYQDEVEAQQLYQLIENEIVPTFYQRDEGYPVKWVQMMRNAIRSVSQKFNTRRMVKQYAEEYYKIASKNYSTLVKNRIDKQQEFLYQWENRMKAHWNEINVHGVLPNQIDRMTVGEELSVLMVLETGSIPLKDLKITLDYQVETTGADSEKNGTVPFELVSETEGKYELKAVLPCDIVGHYSFRCTISPQNAFGIDSRDLGLIIRA
jgi:glycogen phosphorylase